jgi:hypothetical protein
VYGQLEHVQSQVDLKAQLQQLIDRQTSPRQAAVNQSHSVRWDMPSPIPPQTLREGLAAHALQSSM